jgi:hypothetical protein
MPFIVLDPTLAEPAPAVSFGLPLTSVGDTLDDILSELLLALGTRTDVTPARAKKWINVAYRRFCSSLDLDMMEGSYGFTTVAGQPLYMLPDGVFFIRNVSYTDETDYPVSGGTLLEKTDLMSYRRKPVTTSMDLTFPTEFFRYSNMLVLYPTPQSAFDMVVDFRIKPQDLVADTDSPFIPNEYHDDIFMLARQIGFSRLMEFDKSISVQNERTDAIREKLDPRGQEDQGKVIRSSIPRRGRSVVANSPRQNWRDQLDRM